MLQRFASTAFVAGTLLSAFMPAVGLARDHGGNSGDGRHSSSARSSRGSGARYSEERRGYSNGPSYSSRGYIAPRSYGRRADGGYYGGGLSLSYGTPYGYAYAPGYAYGPGSSSGYAYGPAPAPQTCAPGTYDRYGNWIPNPNCYSDPQQYPQQPQQNYDPNQQQYQQQYQQAPQQQPNYAPAQPQQYSR